MHVVDIALTNCFLVLKVLNLVEIFTLKAKIFRKLNNKNRNINNITIILIHYGLSLYSSNMRLKSRFMVNKNP